MDSIGKKKKKHKYMKETMLRAGGHLQMEKEIKIFFFFKIKIEKK